MASSQPPNQPRCNWVALLSVTKHNSQAQAAGSCENEPGGDLTSLTGPSSRSPCRSLPLPTVSGPSSGSRPGHASSARGCGQAPGARSARDLRPRSLLRASPAPAHSVLLLPVPRAPDAPPPGGWGPWCRVARSPVTHQ